MGGGFLLSCLLTPLARWQAKRWGLVDRPDAHRKMHANPVPVAGGIAVLASAALALAGALLFSNSFREHLKDWPGLLLGLFLASLLLCTLGVLDDIRRLRGRQKLLGQLVAVGVVIGFGVRVHHIQVFEWNLELGILAIPFTIFWLLGAINSLNLLDGMDGLLGSVSTIISVAIALMAVVSGHWAAACIAMALAGSLLGFLRYNLPPASIFLGDAGSMVIGLVIGVLGIQSSLKGPATIALIAPLAILTIPIFDTAAAVVRRKLTGKSIYTTDRGHLHHCLLQRGFSPGVALLVITSFCLLTVLGALASLHLKNELIAILTILLVITILIVTRLFGHAEMLLIGKRMGQVLGGFLPGSERGARQIEMRVQGSTSWSGLLDMITDPDLRLNLQTVCLDVSAPSLHEQYHAKWDRSEEPVEEQAYLWHLELPLAIHGRTVGRLKVVGCTDEESIADKIATLLKVIKEFEVDLPVPDKIIAAPARPYWKLKKEPEPAILAIKVSLAGQNLGERGASAP